jgi:hypothetical protein
VQASREAPKECYVKKVQESRRHQALVTMVALRILTQTTVNMMGVMAMYTPDIDMCTLLGEEDLMQAQTLACNAGGNVLDREEARKCSWGGVAGRAR